MLKITGVYIALILTKRYRHYYCNISPFRDMSAPTRFNPWQNRIDYPTFPRSTRANPGGKPRFGNRDRRESPQEKRIARADILVHRETLG